MIFVRALEKHEAKTDVIVMVDLSGLEAWIRTDPGPKTLPSPNRTILLTLMHIISQLHDQERDGSLFRDLS